MLNSFKSLGLLASLASAAAISDFDLVSRQDTTTTSTCSTGLHLMIAGGCAIPCLADVPSLLSTLIGNLTAAFPGTDQYYVPYNNVSFQGQVSTPVMIAAANQYFVDCPNTPVVFIGYSLGGIIVMNTLCGGLSVTNVPNVLAAVTYGEETYRYPLSYDAGDCTNSAPNYPRNNTQNCLPFAPAIQNICAATDPNCCVGGQDYLSHYTYPQFYDYKMVDFIKAKYAALQASKAATSTTASSTTSTSTSTSASTVSTVSTVSTTETASASTATVSTTASTTATVAPGTTTVVATTATTTTASTASVSTTVTTISTGSTTTIRSYSNSTFTTTTPSVPGYSGSTTTAVSGSGVASGSTSTSTKTVAISITSTIPAAVSTFPAIPNSAVLVPSSVQASYLPTVVTAVPGGATYSAPGASSASSTATGSSGSGSGSGSSASGTAAGSASRTASGTAIASYTGAADRLSVAGGVVAAGLAAVAMAL